MLEAPKKGTEFTLSLPNGSTKQIPFEPNTVFLVQTGKCRCQYETVRNVMGNPALAFLHYNGINLGPGFKKRVISEGSVIVRAVAYV